MFEKFSDESRRIVIRAHDRAEQLGHGRVGTCHLFLALLRDWEDVPAVFKDVGSPEKLAAIVESQAAPPPAPADGENPVITRELRTTLERAISLSSSAHRSVSPGYLLLASIDDYTESIDSAGMKPQELRNSIQDYLVIERPKVQEEACPTCGAVTKDFGQVRDLTIEVEGGGTIQVYAYFCSRCGSTYGLVKGDREEGE